MNAKTMKKNRDVLVVGAGIAGMQASLLLADRDRRVYLMDSAPAIGGFFPLLDRQFPTNSCGVCFMSPLPRTICPIYESEFHEDIELLTNCDLRKLEGQAGDFKVSYTARPTKVDALKCTSCGACAAACPVEVARNFGAGLEKRKAIYVPFPQATPRSYVVDPQVCTGCGECVKACPRGAIDLKQPVREDILEVGAIVLGFGFKPFRADVKGEYGHGRYTNVLSSIQYERMLSSGGPSHGRPARVSDGQPVRKVAFIQCVGSRDTTCGQEFCSSVCCMYTTKQAMLTKDQAPQADTAVFYMDIRTSGKDYEAYYERARTESGVRYIHSAVSGLHERGSDKSLLLSYVTAQGKVVEEVFDLVVLSTGFTAPASILDTAGRIGLDLNEYNYCATDEFSPTRTSVDGIFVAGAFREPRDIPETVVEACAAAGQVAMLLDDFKEAEAPGPAPPEREIGEDELRIGVFLCDHKDLLAEALDLQNLAAMIEAEPGVVCAMKIEVDSLAAAAERIGTAAADGLTRIVLAGYRGVPLARALRQAGVMGGYGNLVEIVNIGEQCAGVHDDRRAATEKAAAILQAGIHKVASHIPLRNGAQAMTAHALVVGGGVAGMAGSLALAEQGIDVTLVEKEAELGGLALTGYNTIKGTDIRDKVKGMVARVEEHPGIDIVRQAELIGLTGDRGDFLASLRVKGGPGEKAGGEAEDPNAGDNDLAIRPGAVIFATGGDELRPTEYLYGEDQRVLTQREFDQMLGGPGAETRQADIAGLKSVVMIQCVGSREGERPYCSRVCCTHAVKNALKLKKLNPDAAVYVLYRDMRTFGFYEKYYHQARDAGVLFIRYDVADKPRVAAGDDGLAISLVDPVIQEPIELTADMLVLSAGTIPNDLSGLADIAGVATNRDGFFKEAHPKAAPLDATQRGKFFCGLAHSPMFIGEAINQGQAAAARAAALLWQRSEELAGSRAYVHERICRGCGLCVAACPYEARQLDGYTGKALVKEALCQGCGICAITCPNGASQQHDFERTTMMDVLDQIT